MFWIIYNSLPKCANVYSRSGNRTPVSRVTGGDTHHYTNEDTQTTILAHGFPSIIPVSEMEKMYNISWPTCHIFQTNELS